MHLVGARRSRCRRARAAADARRLAEERSPRRRSAMRCKRGATLRHRRCRGADRAPGIEVIIEATGDPERRHPACARGDRARQAHRHGQRRGRCAGGPAAGAQGARRRASSIQLAWGDQPALICEHVDWARACGFKVVAAGKGTRYEPHYHRSNARHGLGHPRQVSARSRTAARSIRRCSTRFVDGTKSGIEMTAVCNATGLVPQTQRPGLSAGDPLRARRRLQAEERRRHAGEGGRDRGVVLGLSRRHATCRIIWRSAPMWCSRARATTRGAASRNTPAAGQKRHNTPRSTGRCT